MDIKWSIDKYSRDVTSYVDEGELDLAWIGIDDAIVCLEDGYRKMPSGAIGAYTAGLIVRFEMFRDYCHEEGVGYQEKLDNVKSVMELIEERLHVVELGTKPFL